MTQVLIEFMVRFMVYLTTELHFTCWSQDIPGKGIVRIHGLVSWVDVWVYYMTVAISVTYIGGIYHMSGLCKNYKFQEIYPQFLWQIWCLQTLQGTWNGPIHGYTHHQVRQWSQHKSFVANPISETSGMAYCLVSDRSDRAFFSVPLACPPKDPIV